MVIKELINHNENRLIRKCQFIGLHGFARAGKDEIAKILKDFNYNRIGLADPIRESLYILNPWVKVGYGFAKLQSLVDEKGWETLKESEPEVRGLLQRFGTEVGRNLLGSNVWITIANQKIKKNDYSHVVISDIRFENEVEWLKSNKGILIKVKRPNVNSVNSHISDKGIDDDMCDFIINNDGTLDDLKNQVINVLEQIKQEEK